MAGFTIDTVNAVDTPYVILSWLAVLSLKYQYPRMDFMIRLKPFHINVHYAYNIYLYAQ